MSKTERGIGLDMDAQQTDKPLVCLSVRPSTEADRVAGVILRAAENDHAVVVEYAIDGPRDAVTFAKRLGVQLIQVDKPSGTDGASDRTLAYAREHGYPGILWVSDLLRTDETAPGQQPRPKINFSKSVNELQYSDSYVVDAVTGADATSTSQAGVLVGIPAYNEASTIEDVATEAATYADQVVVVDDASQDATADRARQAGVDVIKHTQNQGYGGALKTLFDEAITRDTQHLVILDGDGQHNPRDIPTAIQTQKDSNADIVIGNRFMDESNTDLPRYRRFGLGIINVLTNLSMGVVRRQSWVQDTQSGFRVYNRQAIESLSQSSSIDDGMSASTDILYHAHQQDYTIEEFSTTINYDVDDPSSHNPFKHGFAIVGNLLKTVEQERPILTLSLPGFLGMFVGIGFGYMTILNFLSTDTFPLGLAITSAVFGLSGIFACFTGVILHSLNTHLSR